MVPLVGKQGLVEALCYSNLSRNIVVVARRFVDVSNMVNQVLRPYGPPYFPTSSI